ncbi:MAG: trigger factor [Clostridia bacterium]|nr:trigger factor [Clostridia bacterium]
MALLKKEQREDKRWELQFSIPEDDFKKAVDAVAAEQLPKFNIPGFRKGKAPRAVIEKMYGKGVFYEDALNRVLPTAFTAAVEESGLDVIGQPEFDIVSMDGDVVMSAVVYVKPEGKIEGYKGISVKKVVAPVTDEDVTAEVDRMRERNARTVEVTDRAAALGDTATIDYLGEVDGVAFDGGAAEGHDLKLGSGSFIPGFEDQIVGHNIGETFDVNVTFPEEYHAPELAGKAAVFHVTLHALSMSELPEADDEFAKDVSEFDTLDAYKADIKTKMQERNEKAADSDVENQLCEALIDLLVADIPEPMFVAETENYVRDYDTRLRMQGLDLETYFRYTGLTLDALRAQLRPQAEKQVKVRLALETIAKLENLTVSEEELEAEYVRISETYQRDLAEVKGLIKAEDLTADLLVKKAMDLVKENAVYSAE